MGWIFFKCALSTRSAPGAAFAAELSLAAISCCVMVSYNVSVSQSSVPEGTYFCSISVSPKSVQSFSSKLVVKYVCACSNVPLYEMELSRILRVARFLEFLYRPCILLASRALNLLLFGMPLPMGARLGGGFVVFVSEGLLRDRVVVGLDSWMARSFVSNVKVVPSLAKFLKRISDPRRREFPYPDLPTCRHPARVHGWLVGRCLMDAAVRVVRS